MNKSYKLPNTTRARENQGWNGWIHELKKNPENKLEQQMLMNLHKKNWNDGLALADYEKQSCQNEETVKTMIKLVKNYKKMVDEEQQLSKEKLAIRHVGKINPKRHLEEKVEVLMSENITQCLTAMLSTVVFS